MVTENRLYWGPNKSYQKLRIKRFLTEIQDGIVPSTWWTFDDVGHNDKGQKETGELLGKKIFSTPKPIRFIRRILDISTLKDDVVLDFFSSSAATSHAAMSINAENGGNRRCIMVQLPEPCSEKSEAYKAGYQTIADIGKDRIRRAGKKILQDNAGKEGVENLDIGFKVIKLDSSNIKPWDADFDNLEETRLNAVDNIKAENEFLSDHETLDFIKSLPQ